MKNGNRISATLTDKDAAEIEQHLTAIEQKLPFLLTLTPEESQGLRNLGFDGVPYAEAGLDAVRADINFTRRSFSLEEYERDITLYKQLSGILARVAALKQRVQDTQRLTGSDIMVSADDIYEDMRKDNGETAAVQAPLQRMKRRYPHRKATPDTTPPATPAQ